MILLATASWPFMSASLQGSPIKGRRTLRRPDREVSHIVSGGQVGWPTWKQMRVVFPRDTAVPRFLLIMGGRRPW